MGEVERVGARIAPDATAQPTTKPSNHPGKTLPSAPDWLPADTWQAFIAHRRAKHKPLTPQAATLTLRDLAKAREYGHDPVELIEAAISAGWTGCVFADKHFHPADPTAHPPRHVQQLSQAGEQQLRNLKAWIEQQNSIEITAHELH